MKHGTSTAAIFVMLIVIVILCLIIFLGDKSPEAEQLPEPETPGTVGGDNAAEDQTEINDTDPNVPEEEETENDPESAENEDIPDENTEVAEPSVPQVQVPEVQVPEPQPVPEQPAQFVPRSIGSGSFRSDTGVSVNLIAYWSAQTTSDSTVEVTVDVYVESYALFANASPGGLVISAYGTRTVRDVPALAVDSSALTQTYLASCTYTVNLSDGNSATVPIKAEWLFGGVYSDVELPVVECGGDAVLVR